MIDAWSAFHEPSLDRERPHPADTLATTRHLKLPPDRMAIAMRRPVILGQLRRFDIDRSGWFELTEELTPAVASPTTWRGRGRVHGTGLRVIRYTTVNIEISAWSNRACHLWLAPVSRHADQWGRRRHQRFFDLAHDTCDHIARVINDPDRTQRSLALERRHERVAPRRPTGEPKVA